MRLGLVIVVVVVVFFVVFFTSPDTRACLPSHLTIMASLSIKDECILTVCTHGHAHNFVTVQQREAFQGYCVVYSVYI